MNTVLRVKREASGKTQRQVAESVGVSEISYQRIEYNKQTPRLQTAIRIAESVNSTVEELFGEKQNAPDDNRASKEQGQTNSVRLKSQ